MAFNVTTKDNYWISPNAVSISLNALGDADRIQCSVAAGATILCYVKGVTDGDGLEFDVGHKYKHWPLSIAPTFFDTHTAKYLYVAIPRSSDKGTTAMFVFPPEKLDVYGCNELGEQIGSTDNFYIWLQGIISSSGESGIVQRQWMQQPDWGWLDSNEQYSAGGDSTWWTYNPITDMVTFLKKIATAVFEYLKADDAEIGRLTVTNDATINGTTYTDHVQSKDYTGDGMFDTGYLLQYLSGKAKLVVDQIVCRGKFVVNEIEDRIWTYSGGNLIFSAAGSTIFYVEYLDNSGTPLGYTYINSPWLLRKVPLLARVIAWSKRKQIQRSLTPEEKARVVTFRCYETSDDGTMQTRNWWHVGDIALCQTLNRVKNKSITSGSYSGSLSNTVYARRVIAIGSKKIAYSDDNTIHDYVDLSRADCDPQYNDWPAAGDVLVQRGSFTNTDRQGFSTIEVTGDERGYKVYDGINGYDISGKKKTFIGYDARNQRALLEVFGDAYIGDMGNPDVHEGNSYVKYSAAQHLLKIKGIIEATSTVGDSTTTLANYINGVMDPTVQDIENDLESVRTQQEIADGEIARAYTRIDLADFEASSSVSLLGKYAEDGVIDVHEKAYLKQDLKDMDKLYQDTINQATYYGVDATLFTQSYNLARPLMVKYTANPTVPTAVESDYYDIYPFYNAYADINLQISVAANQKVDAIDGKVNNLADDGIISGGSEKLSVSIDWLQAVSEYKKYMEQAEDYFGTETATKTAAFTTAYTNLAKMLNNGVTPTAAILNGTDMPSWLDRGTSGLNHDTVLADTPTGTSANYRSVWNAYHLALNSLLEEITKEGKRLSGVAQTSANTALSKLSDMASDSKLDASEKQEVKKEFENSYHEMMDSTGIIDKAKDAGGNWIIDYNTWIKPYQDAFAAIGKYLNGGANWSIPSSLTDSTMPSWIKAANMGTTNDIAGDTWRTLWSTFYTARAAVLTTLTEHAQSTANSAQTSAAQALAKISDMASDSKFDPSEKQEVKKEFENCYHEMMDSTGILAKAKSGGAYIIDEVTWITPYRNAFAAIGKYLNGGTNWSIPASLTDSTMPSWIKSANMSATNDIAGDTWRTLWSTFYTARAAVLTTLTEHAQLTANDSVTRLNTWASDNYISPAEKYALGMEWANETKIYNSLLVDAARYAVSTSALTTAWEKADAAVTKYTATTTENIAVGSDYGDIAAYYTAKKTVQDALTAAVYGKINQTQLDVNALNYLKDAMENGQTTTLGGLILSSTIALLDKQKNIQAGMNGIWNTTLGGKTIAAWFGGPNVDHERTPSAQNYAKALFRMDGSGYLAAGLISWNENGVLTAANFANVTTHIGDIVVDNTTIPSSTLKAICSMFELTGSGTTADPYVIKAKYSLYSEGDISAYGQSSGGGGGGGGASVLDDLNDVVISSPQNGQGLIYDSTSGKWKNQAVSGGGGGSLATLSDVNIGSQSDGQVLTWNALQRKWIASSVSGGLTMSDVWAALASDTLTQINISHLSDALTGYAKTADLHTHSNKSVLDGISSDKVSHWDTAYGWGNHATAGYAAAAALSNYLPLTGGTLTGRLQVNATIFGYNYSNSNNAAAFIFDKPGSNYTGIGANGESDQIYFGACNENGAWVDYAQKWYFNGDVRTAGNIRANGSLQAQSVVIEQTNEINSYSGMLHLNYRVNTGVSLCIGGGYVGIGTDSPSCKLHVAGDIYASGDVTAASDGRQKDIVDDACLTVEQIAEAPAVKFTWKDKRDEDIHAGTIAQYWQEVLPEVVKDKDGSLSMNYGSASMISVVSLAREMMKMREHVSELEAEIKRLKEAN